MLRFETQMVDTHWKTNTSRRNSSSSSLQRKAYIREFGI